MALASFTTIPLPWGPRLQVLLSSRSVQLEVVCEEGHTMDGTPQGRSSFEMKCQETDVYAPVPPELPVNCGTPPRGNHSTVNPTEVYDEKAD